MTGDAWWAAVRLLLLWRLHHRRPSGRRRSEQPARRESSRRLASDPYYRVAAVPLRAGVLVFLPDLRDCCGTARHSRVAWIGLVVAAGVSSGTAITVGHELGHKPNRLDQWGAKLANAVTGYGHFCIEHKSRPPCACRDTRGPPPRPGSAKACGALQPRDSGHGAARLADGAGQARTQGPSLLALAQRHPAGLRDHAGGGPRADRHIRLADAGVSSWCTT